VNGFRAQIMVEVVKSDGKEGEEAGAHGTSHPHGGPTEDETKTATTDVVPDAIPTMAVHAFMARMFFSPHPEHVSTRLDDSAARVRRLQQAAGLVTWTCTSCLARCMALAKNNLRCHRCSRPRASAGAAGGAGGGAGAGAGAAPWSLPPHVTALPPSAMHAGFTGGFPGATFSRDGFGALPVTALTGAAPASAAAAFEVHAGSDPATETTTTPPVPTDAGATATAAATAAAAAASASPSAVAPETARSDVAAASTAAEGGTTSTAASTTPHGVLHMSNDGTLQVKLVFPASTRSAHALLGTLVRLMYHSFTVEAEDDVTMDDICALMQTCGAFLSDKAALWAVTQLANGIITAYVALLWLRNCARLLHRRPAKEGALS